MNSTPASETILVVSGCESIGEWIEILLCRVGYQVLVVANDDDALRLARETHIDLLMVDVDMSPAPGRDLTEDFAAIRPSTPVVLISSCDLPSKGGRPFEVLLKPFTLAELRDTVRRAIRGSPATFWQAA